MLKNKITPLCKHGLQTRHVGSMTHFKQKLTHNQNQFSVRTRIARLPPGDCPLSCLNILLSMQCDVTVVVQGSHYAVLNMGGKYI